MNNNLKESNLIIFTIIKIIFFLSTIGIFFKNTKFLLVALKVQIFQLFVENIFGKYNSSTTFLYTLA